MVAVLNQRQSDGIFREMLQPHIASGQVTLKLNHIPVAALKSNAKSGAGGGYGSGAGDGDGDGGGC